MNKETDTYLALYADGHNENIKLDNLLHKGGAAGKIYNVNSKPDIVAKIFHSREHSDTNRKKLAAMLQNKPNIPTIPFENKEYIQIAWPIALLEDQEGFCIGYLMPLIDTNEAISLDHIIQKAIRRKLGLSERYIDRVFAAYNITSVVAALHACGHYIVDLKPSNISIYKKTMLVALFDCDGFSIKGENNERYPAEYVSEEYIYPEGLKQTCQEMGEEQDKFALAVMIFKLLNEGIHPFSGTPRKDQNMLSLQERIFNFHYAYGIWPDTYQAPHPYSIHDYFDKNTMNMFERAFSKGNIRPSALEWQTQLEYILKHLKQCKKDKNHAYFTAKGCGLCMVNDKFKATVDDYKKKKEADKQNSRHMQITKVDNTKKNQLQTTIKTIKESSLYGYYAFIAVYLIFFAHLYKILSPLKENLQQAGIFAQIFIITLSILAINKLLEKAQKYFSVKKTTLIKMLQIFGFACLIISFIALNGSFSYLLQLAP